MGQGFEWKEGTKKVELRWNGKPVTAYCYFDSTEKPILYPVRTLSGITVTRGYPIAPRAGERTDHPHHAGIWFNYESVNGLDFWNNSDAIPAERKPHYGSIEHKEIVSKKASANTGGDTTTSNHMRNFMECVRSRKQTNAPVEAGYEHSIACIMTNAAVRTGEKATFDEKTQEVMAGGKVFKY